MTEFKIPAPDAPAEEWGRLAISIPGCRWMPGMRDGDDGSRCVRIEHRTLTGLYDAIFWDGVDEGVVESDQPSNAWPDPDDPATEGCLFRMMGNEADSLMLIPNTSGVFEWYDGSEWQEQSLPLGRACIAAAAALGRWPGGEE